MTGWIANQAGNDTPPALSSPPWSFGWFIRSTCVMNGAALSAACLGLVDFSLHGSAPAPASQHWSLQPSLPKAKDAPLSERTPSSLCRLGNGALDLMVALRLRMWGMGFYFRAPEVLPLKGPQSCPCGGLIGERQPELC